MIEAFQHVGIGVSDADRSLDFYKKVLGFSLKLNDHEEESQEMVPIVGALRRMRMIMSMNLSGGAAVEIIQHTDSEPRPLPDDAGWGDLGYLSAGVKAFKLDELMPILEKKGAKFVTPIVTTEVSQGGTWRSVFLRDPDGLVIELLETEELRVAGRKPRVGGFSHVVIGVSDVDRAMDFLSKVVGYDAVVFDREEARPELEPVTGGLKARTVMLKRSRAPQSALPLEGGMVQLVQSSASKSRPLYEGRRWGDVGIMEMAMDVIDVVGCYDLAVEAGAEAFCPPTHMDMGMGSIGTFAYIKDPDGNIVEMVEVKKLGFMPPKVVAPLLSGVLKLRSKF